MRSPISLFLRFSASAFLALAGIILAQDAKVEKPAPPESKPAAAEAKPAPGRVTVEIPLPDPALQAAASPVGRAAAPVLEAELALAFNAFFARLKDGKVLDAYTKLLEKSRIGKEPAIIDEFVTKTSEMLKVHGQQELVELLRVRPTGKNLREIIYQVSSANHPSRWRIFAYNGGGRWQVLDIDVSSDLTKMID